MHIQFSAPLVSTCVSGDDLRAALSAIAGQEPANPSGLITAAGRAAHEFVRSLAGSAASRATVQHEPQPNNIEAMLKHARKRMQQRAGKPDQKHARETMTNQNDTSQAKLTDDQIEVLAKKHIARTPIGWTNLPHRVPYRQTEQFRRVKALIGDVLSRLRAQPRPRSWTR